MHTLLAEDCETAGGTGMSSKTGDRSLVSLLLERLFNKTDAERDETFSSWFTYDEIDWFRDNADLSKMDPCSRGTRTRWTR